MGNVTIASAREFVKAAELPEAMPALLGAAAKAEFDFDAAREQAAVVGADVIGFVKGITAEQRKDVVNASLLAQLVASKALPEPRELKDVLAWFDRYFDTLSRIGFAIQEKGFAQYVESSDTFQAHQAIIDVATMLLAGSPAALAIVTKTLGALQKMSADSPWITLFDRESQSASTAHMQVSLVDADENAPFLLSTIAFGVEAESDVTQVLFFKFQKSQVKLRYHSGKATIDADLLAGVRGDIAAKLAAFTRDFVAGLEL